jgi:hypothetical protein
MTVRRAARRGASDSMAAKWRKGKLARSKPNFQVKIID